MALLEYSDKKAGPFYELPTPAPENYNPTYTHMENSYVSANGYFIRDIIRRNRAKVVCGWNSLDGDETALLQSLYDKDYFYLKFTDKYNRRVIKKVYAGPLDGKAKFMDLKTYKISLNTGLSMNFIEY